MPLYDYYSEETDEHKEVFHLMDENPKILDSQGNIMKRVFICGHGGDIIKGGTRNRTIRQKFGHRKTENMPTPTESAQAKAAESLKNSKKDKYDKNDPYKQFRK